MIWDRSSLQPPVLKNLITRILDIIDIKGSFISINLLSKEVQICIS